MECAPTLHLSTMSFNPLLTTLLRLNTRHCFQVAVVAFKCSLMHYGYRKHLLQILIFFFIINKYAPLQNVTVCGQSTVQCIIGVLHARQCTALAVIIFYKFLATDYLD